VIYLLEQRQTRCIQQFFLSLLLLAEYRLQKIQFRDSEGGADQLVEATSRYKKAEAFSNFVVSHHNAADMLFRYWFSLHN